jgi:hypothetical protein
LILKYLPEVKKIRRTVHSFPKLGVRATSEKLEIPIKTLYLWQGTERLGRGKPLKG